MAQADPAAEHGYDLRDLLAYFLRLGSLGFGLVGLACPGGAS